MLVYHYNPDTLLYSHSNNEGYESPLEKEVYIIPPNSTLIKPPEYEKGILPKWNKELNKWEEYKIPTEIYYNKLRFIRNKLLQETDYLMMPDYPLSSDDKIKWSKYRQELRDLPNNIKDINNIIFPIKPII